VASNTIKDVARVAGVSIATVSRCINSPAQVRPKTREKVMAAVQETGYAPNKIAQSFRSGRTHVIMVVLPSVGDPFFTEVMTGVRAAAQAAGYSILINETQFNTMTDKEIGALIVSKQVDGIILLASMSPFGRKVLSAHSKRAIPFVVGCEKVSDDLVEFPSIHIDNLAAAEEATNLLIGLGHERIAFMSGDPSSLLTHDREAGYRKAMTDAALNVPEQYTVHGYLTIDGAKRAANKLLNEPVRPTAMFCANDEMAIGTLHCIRQAGLRVPEDISVVGFDDTRYAEVAMPPLTTISQPAAKIGKRTVERLVEAIEGVGTRAASPELLPHKLIIRQSVGPVPSA